MSAHDRPVPDLFAEAARRARETAARKRPRGKRVKRAPTDDTSAWTEAQHQAKLFRWAASQSVVHDELIDLYAIPNAGGYVGGYEQNLARVQAMKREGVRAGVPDVHLPHGRGGFLSLYIENKRPGKKATAPTDRQLDRHERLRAAGHHVVVARGWEEARDAILAYLALPKTETRSSAA